MVMGLKIQFVNEFWQEVEPYPYRFGDAERRAIDFQLEQFLAKDIIIPTDREEGQYVSNIFSRPKSDGTVRIILDLSKLNNDVEKVHFKMTSLQTALEMIRPGCFMASVDLKDAYYSVLIHEENQKFLKFWWNGQLFQFKGMPNGLTSAPRAFTKLLIPVFAHLREKGHECFGYIDDTFIVGDSFEEALFSCQQLAATLDNLGFVVHEHKSVMIPRQELVFLGFKINSVLMTVTPTQGKIDKFLRTVTQLRSVKRPSIRQVAGLIGLMVAYNPGVKYAGAYIKTLEIEKNKALKRSQGNFDAKMAISANSWSDIDWWVVNLPSASRPVQIPRPDGIIYTDASHAGWGAFCEDNSPTSTGGRWKPHEGDHHINVLELRAIHHGIKSMIKGGQKHIKVMTDNTTALAYIKNMGGVQSEECNLEAKRIWQYCELNELWLTPAHIPGKLNVQADRASRHFSDDTEWELAPRIWDKIVCNL